MGSTTETLVGTQKAMPVSFLIQLRDDLCSPSAITPQHAGRATYSLLSGSDGMDRGHESLRDVKVVVDDWPQGNRAVGGKEGIASNLEGVVILLWFTSITNMGTSAGEAKMMNDPLGSTLQVSPSFLQGSEDTSGYQHTQHQHHLISWRDLAAGRWK